MRKIKNSFAYKNFFWQNFWYMITLILRSIIIYTIVLLAVRLMGKRQIGDMQPFELVVTLIIADLACIPMSDVSIPIVFGIVPLLTLVVVHHIFTLLNRKSTFFRTLLNGKPIIVINPNGIDYAALTKLNMTLNDLNEGLRVAGCFNIADVAYAIVETNGNISVMQKPNVMPPSCDDMKIKPDDAQISLLLINDGKVLKNNLQKLNLSDNFLSKILKKQGNKHISDVLIFAINKKGEAYYQEKNKNAISFSCEVKNEA